MKKEIEVSLNRKISEDKLKVQNDFNEIVLKTEKYILSNVYIIYFFPIHNIYFTDFF